MKVYAKNARDTNSIANEKHPSYKITKMTKKLISYDNVVFLKLAALCTSFICPQAAPLDLASY